MARYIDADEALIMMQHSKEDDPYYGDWYMAHDCCIDCVNTVPTADVAEVKHGYWIPSRNGINPIRYSVCNMPAPMAAGNNESGDFEIRRYPSRYCHECGAKMDGKDGAK